MQRFNKDQCKRLFHYNWFVYPIIILVVSLLWVWGFQTFHLPTHYEGLTVFIGARKDKFEYQEKLKNVFTPHLREFEDIGIKRDTGNIYFDKLNIALNDYSDILIIDDYTMDLFRGSDKEGEKADSRFPQFFTKLNTDYVKSFLPNDTKFYVDPLDKNGDSYALEFNAGKGFDKHWLYSDMEFDKEQKYYLLLSYTSINLGEINSKDNKSTLALDAIKYFYNGIPYGN